MHVFRRKSDALAFLLNVEPQVLKEENRPRSRIGASGFNFRPAAIRQEPEHVNRRLRCATGRAPVLSILPLNHQDYG